MIDDEIRKKMGQYLEAIPNKDDLEQILEASALLNEISALADGHRMKLLEEARVRFPSSIWPSYYLAMHYESIGNLYKARQYSSLINLEEIAENENCLEAIVLDINRLNSSK